MSINHDNSVSIPGNQPSSQTSGPAPGGRLKGRYLIERELGRGGVGVVFLARDERLHGMPVVIKFLLDAAERNQWLTGKFSQEAEALTRINHPGVVRVIDRDISDDGRPFFVMEFIKGRPLREVMKSAPIDLAYIARIVRQIGSALHAAHQQGVFHRDLKPENIMLEQLSDGEEQIKLIDFGIAKVTNPQAGSETEVAIVAGSWQYIAPEQLLSQMASPATDIYALAIIVYEMVTGRLPFNPQAETHFLVMQELMRLQQSESFARPQTLRPDLPAAAQTLLLNALSFDPRRRPQNARVFAEDLAQSLMGNIRIADERETVAVPAREAPPSRATTPAPQTETEESQARATTAQTPGAKSRGGKLPIIIGGLIIAIIAAAIAVKTLSPSAESNSKTMAGAERTLNYSVTLRKDPERYPDSAPFQIPGEVVFSPGDRIHFSFSSPQSGYLYIINESPAAPGQAAGFNILFPSPTANQGSARLTTGQTARIPDHDIGFVFDKEQGAEKLWLIWAADAVAELEPLKRWANSEDAGEIKDTAQAESLRGFLAARSASQPQVERDETNKQTTIKMKGDVLVKLVNLQHY